MNNQFFSPLITTMYDILRAIESFFPLMWETLYWMFHELWHSANVKRNEKVNLSRLMIANHVLEKGITMPKRRLGFGYEVIRGIIKKCRNNINSYSANHIEIQSAIDILEQYYQIHIENNFKLPNDIVIGIQEISKHKIYDTKLCYQTTKADYFSPTDNFYDFAHSRHSVRWYSEEKIPDESIINAIKLAQTAPSACNRQSTKVYIITTDDKKKKILQLQKGNRGFGHQVDRILLVTSDMGYWNCRNMTSAYLDAGIFTMNLLYALHYYKICACTLNAHLSIKQKKKLKSIVGYSESEIPVVFVAIGKAPESFMITGSQRVTLPTMYEMI